MLSTRRELRHPALETGSCVASAASPRRERPRSPLAKAQAGLAPSRATSLPWGAQGPPTISLVPEAAQRGVPRHLRAAASGQRRNEPFPSGRSSLVKKRPKERGGSAYGGLLRTGGCWVPRLSMAKPPRLPLCHVNAGAGPGGWGPGAGGQGCSRSTMRPARGMKSASHYKSSGPGEIPDFHTQKPCPGDAPAAGALPPPRRARTRHRRAEMAVRARESPFGVISAGIRFVPLIYCNSWGTRPAAQQLPAPGQSRRWAGTKLPCHFNPPQRRIQPRGRGNGAQTKGSFIAAAGPRRPPPRTPSPPKRSRESARSKQGPGTPGSAWPTLTLSCLPPSP